MSVLICVATTPGALVPLEALGLAASLRAHGIGSRVVPAMTRIPDVQFAALCKQFFWPDLQVVVVVLPKHASQLEPLRERIKHLRLVFPSEVKVWLTSVGPAVPGELTRLPSCDLVSLDRLLVALRALHGQTFATTPARNTRLPLILGPQNYERTKVAELMIQASPCAGVCSACADFSTCDWGSVPTWETFSAQDKEQFSQELKAAVETHKIHHFYLRDFGLDGSLAKANWLLAQVQGLSGPVRFVTDLQLDHWLRQPRVLDVLRAAGLIGVNLDVGSLHGASRRFRGGLPVDGKKALAAFRQASPGLLVHAAFAVGLPGDTEARLGADAQWLLSPAGRECVDSFAFAAQIVAPDSILSRSGGYQFDAAGRWFTATITRDQADALAARMQVLRIQRNFLQARWPTADALLQAVTLGLGFENARDFLRAAWCCDAVQQSKTEEIITHLEDLVSARYANQVLLAADSSNLDE